MQRIVDHFGALGEAIGHRRYLFGALFAAAIGAWDWFKETPWIPHGAPLMTTVVGVPSWVAGIVVLGGVVLWSLLSYATKLKTTLEPHIRLLSPVRDYDGPFPHVYLRVENISGTELRRCLVKIEGIAPLPEGWKRSDLPVAIPTDRQREQKRVERFGLSSRGKRRKGEHKDLTFLDYDLEHPCQLYTEHGIRELNVNEPQSYQFTVVAYCEHGDSGEQKFTVRGDSVEGLLVE